MDPTGWTILLSLTALTVLSQYQVISPIEALPNPTQPNQMHPNHVQTQPLLTIQSPPLTPSQMTQLPPPSAILSQQLQRTNSSQLMTFISPNVIGMSNIHSPSQTMSSSSTGSNNINPYARATNEILLELRQAMLEKSMRFDENFRSSLSTSKVGLHKMFQATYGVVYQLNTEIFTNMFESLEKYYADGQVKLTESMRNFFDGLYQKAFQVFNNYRDFSPEDLKCATRQMSKLKPFKDVPDKLIDGIRRAFVSARTFVQALNKGIDVIKRIISLGQSPLCINLINEKLLKNTIILNNNQGQPTVVKVPCLNFCEQVITRCIGKDSLDQLQDGWKNFILLFNELALKLSTSYNFETIITPLDVQISEAIMNFQENGANITEEVFSICGKPPTRSGIGAMAVAHNPRQVTNRVMKRNAPIMDPESSAIVDRQRHHIRPANLRSPTQNMQGSHYMSHESNERFKVNARDSRQWGNHFHLPDDLVPIGLKSPSLIEEIRNYMLSTRSFWSSLPNAVCTSNHTLGSKVATSSMIKKQNCFQEHFSLMDINFDMRYRNEILQTIAQLWDIQDKIGKALAGQEIDWGSSASESINHSLNPNGAFPSIHRYQPTSTTSTAIPTVEPPSDEEEEEQEQPDHDSVEEGSGEEDGYTPELDEDTEIPLDIEGGDPSTETFAPETSTQIVDNSIESTPSPNDISSNNFIVVKPDAQKSSQSASKLVRDNSFNFILVSLVSMAILFVTRFSVPHHC